MDVTPLIPEGRQIIQAYGASGFKVSGELYPDPIVVYPEGTRNWNTAKSFSDLTENSFDDLLVADLDVLLLGTGAKAEFVSPKLKAGLKLKGVVIEAMDSGAACRTYNVLMAEGRRVAAALLPII